MSVGALLTRGLSGGRIYQWLRGNRAAYTGLPEPPPTGFGYATTTALYSGSGISNQQGASPAIAVGDVELLSLVTSPNDFVLVPNGDGTFVVLSGGNTSRQSYQFNYFRALSNALDTYTTSWIDEVAPTWSTAVLLNTLFGTPISINLAGFPYAVSSEGDSLVFALSTGALPPGVTLSSGGLLSGTPSVSGSYSFTIGATDLAGETTASPPCQIQVVPPAPPGPVFPPAPTLLAPPPDTAGAKIDAQIAILQGLVNANVNPMIEDRLQQTLNQWQVEAVDHYMVTGWANAAVILALFQAPAWDSIGQALTARVAFLQNLFNNSPSMPVGNKDGYGSSGWTTIASNYLQQLYAAQTALVDHLMALPGGTTAAAILSGMTGSQTAPAGIPYAYKFSSVGFTDADTDD